MTIFIDTAEKKNCYAELYSYGEICVGCGCCSTNKKIRHKARLKYWKYRLHDNLHFSQWITEYPEMLALQKKNLSINIKNARKMIKIYSR